MSRAITKKLTSLQWQAAILISGAMHMTATDTLNVHAALLPMLLKIKWYRQRAATQLATLLITHPLHKWITKALSLYAILTHFSSLHELMHKYDIKPGMMEKHSVVHLNTAWDPGLTIRTIGNREDVSECIETDMAGITTFTDGSEYKGSIGTAAVLYTHGKEISELRYHLGSNNDHEVYEAECIELVLAVHLALWLERNTITKLSIWIDNAAAIMATNTAASGPSHYILNHFHNLTKQLRIRQCNIAITISWVPGHAGISGNERADELAKSTTEGHSSERCYLPTLPHSHISVVRTFTKHLDNHHIMTWQGSLWYVPFQNIETLNATTVSGSYWKLSHKLPRRLLTILIQLWTGHIA